MTHAGAEKAVTGSALVCGGVYAYRRLSEGSGQAAPHLASKAAGRQLVGQGAPPPLSHFIVGFGFAFLVVSILAQADPDLGGAFALLIATGVILAQGQQLADDLNGQLGARPVAGNSEPPAYGIATDWAAVAAAAPGPVQSIGQGQPFGTLHVTPGWPTGPDWAASATVAPGPAQGKSFGTLAGAPSWLTGR